MCVCACSFTRTVIAGTMNCHVLMGEYVVTHHVAVVTRECRIKLEEQTLESFGPPVASGML